MDPSDILGRSWELYRSHARPLIVIAAAVFVPLGAVSAVLGLVGWPGILAANVLNAAAIFLVQGALVRAVEDIRAGRRDPSAAEAYGHAGARLVTLAVAGILATLGVIAGLVLFVVPGLVLLTWWLVLSPVIMLEARGVGEAFGRSRELVSGSGWPVFGVMVLTLLVLLAFALVLAIVASPLGAEAGSFIQTAVGNSLAAPFVAVAWTLTYLRLREIEGARPATA